MRKASTKTSSVKRVKISAKTKKLYARRDTKLDREKDSPQLPLEYWRNAVIGRYFRPRKTQISLRIDNDVLDWLKSKGAGHLSRINEILRAQMTGERRG